MSDRDVRDEDLTLDGDVALLCAVLDELALDKVSLVGGSSGGCAAIAFAARFPERVDRLLLYGAYADGSAITSPAVRESIVATVRSHWGLGSRLLADIFLGDTDSVEQKRVARYQREATSPETAAVLLELTYRNDVRSELDQVRAPTLVVHRRGDRAIPYRARPRARGRDPDRDADPARRKRPLSVGRRLVVGGARVAFGARARSSGPRGRRPSGGVALRSRTRGVGVGRAAA